MTFLVDMGVELPPIDALNLPLKPNLVFAHVPQIMMCYPCTMCSGSGRTSDTKIIYDSTTTLEKLRCNICGGLGYEPQYMTLNKLYDTLMPYIMQAFLLHMPDIIKKAKLEMVTQIMES